MKTQPMMALALASVCLCAGCLSPNLGVSASRSRVLQPSHDEFTTQGSFVIRGAASQPGTYSIKGRMTLTQALAAAGGAASDAGSEAEIVRTKGSMKSSHYDLKKIAAGKGDDPVIKDGDMILIKRAE